MGLRFSFDFLFYSVGSLSVGCSFESMVVHVVGALWISTELTNLFGCWLKHLKLGIF